MRRGLALGEKVICTEPATGSDEPLFAVLEAGGVDVAAAIRGGQLDMLPMRQFYSPAGPRVLVERALAQGFPAVRMSVEVRAALTVLSPDAHRENERRMHELVQTHPVSVMCQYARATTHGTRLDELVAVHLAGVHQSTLVAGGDGDGLVLRGEIDTANADVFAALLAAADRAASRALSLDLTGVTYLDAGAVRLLNDATRRFRAAGGQVVLVAPQPPVERTLTLLNLGDLPGMQVAGGQL
jgi:anti-anti-sigma factor